MKSIEHDLSNIDVRGYLDPGSTAVIDCGGVSNALDANSVLDGKLNLRNTKISNPLATKAVIIRNRGFVGNFDLDVTGLTLDCPLATTGALRLIKTSGSDMRRLYLPGYFDPDTNPITVDNGTLIAGIEETGTTNVTTGTGAFFVYRFSTSNSYA